MPRKANFEKDNVDKEDSSVNDKPSEEESSKLSSLRQLVFLGRREETLRIEGYNFKIVSLTNAQQRDVMVDVMNSEDHDKLANMRGIVLSRAVVSVNEVPLEDLYEEDDSEDLSLVEKRKKVLSTLQYSLVERLFSKYNQMSNEDSGDLEVNLKN